MGGSGLDLSGDLIFSEYLEGHAPVHIAVGAFVMGAAPGHTQDKAAGFTGRTEDRSVVSVEKQYTSGILNCTGSIKNTST